MSGIFDQLEQLSTHSPAVSKPRLNRPTPAANPQPKASPVDAPVQVAPVTPTPHETYQKPVSNRDTTTPRHHATMQPRLHDTMIETVRKAVREFGKEAATHRFTMEEKRAIADVIYTYTRQGIRTNENEVTRIAVNFIVSDYLENGVTSILHRVLTELNQ